MVIWREFADDDGEIIRRLDDRELLDDGCLVNQRPFSSEGVSAAALRVFLNSVAG